jgi:hypothetical protein
LRQLEANKSCFDCQQKGTMYCVMAPFFVFVCSGCAGVHRELNNKVKGISMSNFSEAETDALKQLGNKVSPLRIKRVQNQLANLMSSWSEKRDPVPDKKDSSKFKQFLEQKYVQKRWA